MAPSRSCIRERQRDALTARMHIEPADVHMRRFDAEDGGPLF
jgi:hypothetical protein